MRPVTEVERFVYETSGQEDFSQWRSLADVLPKREYTDLMDEEPGEGDREIPDLPTTTRCYYDCDTNKAGEQKDHNDGATAARSFSWKIQMRMEGLLRLLKPSGKQPPQTDVNDYDDSESKKARKDENWVEVLYKEAEMELKFDIYDRDGRDRDLPQGGV